MEATETRVSREDVDTAAEPLERVPGVPITGCFETATPTKPTGWFQEDGRSRDVGFTL